MQWCLITLQFQSHPTGTQCTHPLFTHCNACGPESVAIPIPHAGYAGLHCNACGPFRIPIQIHSTVLLLPICIAMLLPVLDEPRDVHVICHKSTKVWWTTAMHGRGSLPNLEITMSDSTTADFLHLQRQDGSHCHEKE